MVKPSLNYTILCELFNWNNPTYTIQNCIVVANLNPSRNISQQPMSSISCHYYLVNISVYITIIIIYNEKECSLPSNKNSNLMNSYKTGASSCYITVRINYSTFNTIHV